MLDWKIKNVWVLDTSKETLLKARLLILPLFSPCEVWKSCASEIGSIYGNKLSRVSYFLDFGEFGVSERDLEKVGQLKTLCNFSCSP